MFQSGRREGWGVSSEKRTFRARRGRDEWREREDMTSEEGTWWLRRGYDEWGGDVTSRRRRREWGEDMISEERGHAEWGERPWRWRVWWRCTWTCTSGGTRLWWEPWCVPVTTASDGRACCEPPNGTTTAREPSTTSSSSSSSTDSPSSSWSCRSSRRASRTAPWRSTWRTSNWFGASSGDTNWRRRGSGDSCRRRRRSGPRRATRSGRGTARRQPASAGRRLRAGRGTPSGRSPRSYTTTADSWSRCCSGRVAERRRRLTARREEPSRAGRTARRRAGAGPIAARCWWAVVRSRRATPGRCRCSWRRYTRQMRRRRRERQLDAGEGCRTVADEGHRHAVPICRTRNDDVCVEAAMVGCEGCEAVMLSIPTACPTIAALYSSIAVRILTSSLRILTSTIRILQSPFAFYHRRFTASREVF